MSNYLKSVDWKFYIEREQTNPITCTFFLAYSKMLRQATGVSFEHQLYKWNGRTCLYYRSAKEFSKVALHLASLEKKKDRRFSEWIRKETKLQKMKAKFIALKDPEEIFSALSVVVLYNTVIPFLVLHSCKGKKILAQFEKIRATSLYPFFMHKLIEPLLRREARRRNIPLILADALTPDEIINATTVPKSTLEKRNKHSYIYYQNGKVKMYYGHLPKLEKQIGQKTDFVKGTVAYPGTAKGRVKIINTIKAISKFRKGDILVSLNTNPSLMPAISKAAAIVTDEGGAACHAAVISRELKIPCITGTRNATRVFKDGDMIYVDAISGIVKKAKG